MASAAALAILLAGCVSTPQSAALMERQSSTSGGTLAEAVNLGDVPFFPQEEYQCGPAALATVLNASAVPVAPEDLVSKVYVPARKGSFQVEMMAAARDYERLAYELPPSLESVLREVSQGRPVLVMQNLGLDWIPTWHYAVVAGYDLSREELVLRSGLTENYRVPLRVFERTWSRAEHWALVTLRPGELPADNSEERYFQALSAFEKEGREDLVEQGYLAGLERWPGSRLLTMGYGNLLYGTGRLEAALESYQRLVQDHPDYAVAHNNMAQVLIELGRGAEAVDHARRAVRLGGSHVETYQRTLRRSLQETGQEASAEAI